MRKFSNAAAFLLAAAVCAFITWITMDSATSNIIFNLVFLAVMVLIVIAGAIFGFRRITQTQDGLNRASDKLRTTAENGGKASALTAQGARLFEVPYLDEKYQEYLRYLYKTNSPTDIGDYIGEYEINNYTHRRLLEMVPDVLTSLGILGTFVGLVIGLRGFNPTSYEAMSSSVSALIDGIKVAFVTSIYGIALSMAFSYKLRGSLTAVSESLDRFLDTYYTCAVPPTDATAMNHVIANQNAQTKLMTQMSEDLAKQVSQSLESHITPLVQHLDETMDHFTETVTLQQGQLLENISQRIAKTMKQEFFSEFMEMRSVMKETNAAQKTHLQFMQQAEGAFQADFLEGQKAMQKAMDDAAKTVHGSMSALDSQEQTLAEFIDRMNSAMTDMQKANDISLRMTEEMAQLSEMNNRISDKMLELSEANERYTRSLAAVQANNSDLSEGLSVMNDSNIRMTEQISKMNDMTVDSLQEAVKSQNEYVKNVSEYLASLKEQQELVAKDSEEQRNNLREFTDYMTQVMNRMKTLTDSANLAVKEATDRLQELGAQRQAEDFTQLEAQLSDIIGYLEAAQERDIKKQEAEQEEEEAPRRGLFGRR